jgi:glycosyltransferase involved in cell wall biosynthesis
MNNLLQIYQAETIPFKTQTEKLRVKNLLPNTIKKVQPLDVLCITSFPPRECGIATYSQDLLNALANKFDDFNLTVCALENKNEQHHYPEAPSFILNTDTKNAFVKLAFQLNKNESLSAVILQHEFGFFMKHEKELIEFVRTLEKPLIIVFHTVLPNPSAKLLQNVSTLIDQSDAIVVMTNHAKEILLNNYSAAPHKISVIQHGTHLITSANKEDLKIKHGFTGRKVLSTFGLLSSGKSIETTLNALPSVIENNPCVLFLIIGKTHPTVMKEEGEKYRKLLEKKVKSLKIEKNVQFINQYLPLNLLLEYLQLTDIYLFTSNDPNQAVSGTFSYAISCGCPIISTPIPHASEILSPETGRLIDFQDSNALSDAIIDLFNDTPMRNLMSSNALQKMAPCAWENSAISHARLIQNICNKPFNLSFKIPPINLNHIRKLTSHFGMIQFSEHQHPDLNYGYTLDDNARALVAMCMHFQLTKNQSDVNLIETYLHFIGHCMQPNGTFLNYVNESYIFTEQNEEVNLDDANGRAIWALGFVVSIQNDLPPRFSEMASELIEMSSQQLSEIHSPRAMAFIIKGLYYENAEKYDWLITEFANRLIRMYEHEADNEWHWFESSMTYGNSILPEALLCAWSVTNIPIYKGIAKVSFGFLLSKIMRGSKVKVITNKGWLHRGSEETSYVLGGEQAIDVAYTLIALQKFYAVFKLEHYKEQMPIVFSWFLGNNHLNQIMYNPTTGGCYDGLEETEINLNQGAESTVSYLLARLTMEKITE